MRPLETKGRKALNKAYLKVKLGREEIEAFKGHLLTLLGNLAAKGRCEPVRVLSLGTPGGGAILDVMVI